MLLRAYREPESSLQRLQKRGLGAEVCDVVYNRSRGLSGRGEVPDSLRRAER